MADLKNSEIQAGERRIAGELEGAIKSLRELGAEAIEDMRQAAVALAELPRNGSDLLVQSVIAHALEFDIDGKGYVNACDLQITVEPEQQPRSHYQPERLPLIRSGYRESNSRPLPKGRYRALLFLVPLT